MAAIARKGMSKKKGRGGDDERRQQAVCLWNLTIAVIKIALGWKPVLQSKQTDARSHQVNLPI